MFMPSGVIAAAAGGPIVPGQPTFNLVAGTLAHIVSNGSTATVEFELTGGGAENHIKDGNPRIQVGNWIINGFPNEYEIQYDLTGGSAPNVGRPVNQWFPGNELNVWSWSESANNTERISSGFIRIRRISDQVEEINAALFLNVIVGEPGGPSGP